MVFKCCQNKTFSNFCCIVCLNIFHPSCLERKPDWKQVEGYKIFCSLQCENLGDSLKQMTKLRKELDSKNKELEILKHKYADYKTKLNKEQKGCAEAKSLLAEVQSKSLELSENQIQDIAQNLESRVEPLLDQLSTKVITSIEMNNKKMAETFDSLLSTISDNYNSNVDKFIDALGSIKTGMGNFDISNNTISLKLDSIKEKLEDMTTPQASGNKANATTKTQTKPASSYALATPSITSNQVAHAVTDAVAQMQNKQNGAQNQRKNTNASKNNLNKGVASEDTEFAAADNRKMWLYIGKAKETVTCDIIKAYIRKSLGEPTKGEFIVEQLKTVGNTNSFKVGMSMDYYDTVNSNNFWPKGIIFRRFNFSKRTANLGASFSENLA